MGSLRVAWSIGEEEHHLVDNKHLKLHSSLPDSTSYENDEEKTVKIKKNAIGKL